MRASTANARWAVSAAVLYLGCAVWAFRAILPAPAVMLPHAAGATAYWDKVAQSDQFFSVAKITHDARMLVHEPWRLMQGRHCWPMPYATTVGEHMIDEGLVGLVPDLVFHEPILTYNVVLIVLPVIAGIAMYAFVLRLTESPAAALVGGLLFAIHPARLGNAAEPYWMGNHWTPLALLFASRLLVERTWRDAVGLALFATLQLLDSFYPIVAFALVGGAYLTALVAYERRALASIRAQLLVVALVIGAVAWFVFVPYLRTRATWGTLLAGRSLQLYAAHDLAFGGPLFPGTVTTVLAIVAIVDRLRRVRRTRGHDPRIAMVIGGVLVLWAVLAEVPMPFAPWRVPSLLRLLSGVVPGLDAVRVGVAVSSGFYLACAMLAAFGMLVLLDAVPRMRLPLTALVVIAAMVETLHPGVARATFGRAVVFETSNARPRDEVLSLYAHAADGAILDLPVNAYMPAEYVFASAYHGHPTVACYGSYDSPLWPDVADLAQRLPKDHDAELALAALGVGAMVTHGARVAPPAGKFFVAGGPGERTMLSNLERPSAVDASLHPLVAGAANPTRLEVAAGAATVTVPFRNGSGVAYRHPDPIAPSALVARWSDATGALLPEYALRGLLPLALAPGAIRQRELAVPVPAAAGDYRLVVAPVGAPDQIIARVDVHVVPPGGATHAVDDAR